MQQTPSAPASPAMVAAIRLERASHVVHCSRTRHGSPYVA